MGKRRLLKISGTVLLVTWLVFIFGGVACAGFTDVSDNHWAAGSITRMSERGVAGGYQDGSFKPDKTVTQAEAVVMALRAMGLNSASSANLPDVSFPVPGWAEQDIKLAVKENLLKDTDTERFSGNSGATRAWVARLLVRMIGEESRALEESLMPNFTDTNTIPDWAIYYVRVAQDRGLVTGYSDGSFQPQRPVSRAEMASFLDRAGTHLPGSTGTTGSTGTGLTVTGPSGQYGSKVFGSVVKVYPEINTFVVQQNGVNRTLSLPENAAVSVEGSSSSGLNALRQGDEVEVELDTAGYVIGIVVNSRSTGAGGTGIVYDLDLDLDLLTVEYDDGTLTAYQLDRQVAVFLEGVRFPTLLDVGNGDRVRLTVEDSLVTEIEVLEKDVRLNITGEVVVLDTDRDVINLEVDGVLKAYRLAPGVQVTVPGLNSAYLSDIKVGDTVRAGGRDGEITLLEVEGRQAGYSFPATIVAVDTVNRVLTLEERDGDILAYEVLDEARIIIDEDEEDLKDLSRDMEVIVRLLDGDIIYVEVDNSPAGTITDVDAKGLLLVLRRDNGGRNTYVVDDRVRVRSEDGRDDLDEIKSGDYAKLIMRNDRVDEIWLRHTVNCRVESIRATSDRLEVVDDDGDSRRLYIRDDVELVVSGITYPELDDVSEGDLVLATYLGRDLDKVEVLKPYRGSVSSLDVYSRNMTLRLFNGGVKNFNYPAGSRVVTGGATYDSFSALSLGDRVEVVENAGGGYTFNIMEEITGNLAVDMRSDSDSVYLKDGYEWDTYALDENVYVVNAAGYVYAKDKLKSGDAVRLYLLRDLVYAIELR